MCAINEKNCRTSNVTVINVFIVVQNYIRNYSAFEFT